MSGWIDRDLIHARASATSVAMFRIWIFGIWSVLVGRDRLPTAGDFPPELFRHIGIFAWLPGGAADLVTSPLGLAALRWVTLAACLAAVVGLFTRFSVVMAASLLVVHQSVVRGYMGYSNHAEIPLLLAALALAFAPTDHALTAWPRRRPEAPGTAYQFPLVAILALVCTAYLFIGSYRLEHGGLALFRSNSLQEWILSWNLRVEDPNATAGVRWISHPVTAALGRVGFPLLTLLEVSAPLCLISSRWRMVFLPAMLAAHAGILVLMRIDFTAQVLCYLVFIDSRHWSPARSAGAAPPVVFFDGVCGLCNRFVDFVLAHDRTRQLRFAPLQGASASSRFGPVADVAPETIRLDLDGQVAEKSTAVLAILGRLGGPWSLATFLGLVPRAVRDLVYDVVADNRYAWFGRRDTCRLPSAEERAVFLP